MRVDDLKRRQATLEAVRLDIPKWGFGENGHDVAEKRPVVAVDWSEIFCYATYERPREDGTEDSFAAHYAGLKYLLFVLPCRLVLLPPYAAEMKHSVEMLRAQALSVPLARNLGEKYAKLVNELTKFKKNNAALSKLLDGDWTAMDELSEKEWAFLDDVLKNHLPRVYLDVQERTAGAMRALNLLLRAKDSERSRMHSLPGLGALSEDACQGAVSGWDDWGAEMELQRPRLERQNRADALALAYLQALHQAYFWRNVPVYFASRSLSMLQVMENHAGEFEPYPRSDRETARIIQSSWRSWEYFAELGYYAKWSADGEKDGHSLGANDIDQDLRIRMGKIEQRLALPNPMEAYGQDIEGSFLEWETLRGSFDLEGMGDKHHLSEPKLKNPREFQLVELLRSVLNAQDSGSFLERRGSLAKSILRDIADILDALPPDAAIWAGANVDSDEQEPAGTLTEIVKAHWSLPNLFREYLRRSAKASAADLVGEAIALLTGVVDSTGPQRVNSANLLLELMAKPAAREGLSQGSRDWLTGAALFFRTLHQESLSYLSPWVQVHSSSVAPGLDVATRALCADACRPLHDFETGMRFLAEVRDETVGSMTDSEALLWYCLKAQLLLDWMEPAHERFEVFPKPCGRSGEIEIVVPMMDRVLAFVSAPSPSPLPLQMRAANTLLYLTARCIPENAPQLGDERRRKLGWLLCRLESFVAIETWFRSKTTTDPSAAHLDTLGYYNCKMYLATDQGHYLAEVVRFLEDARGRAQATGDRQVQRLVTEHLQWAAAVLGRWQ